MFEEVITPAAVTARKIVHDGTTVRFTNQFGGAEGWTYRFEFPDEELADQFISQIEELTEGRPEAVAVKWAPFFKGVEA